MLAGAFRDPLLREERLDLLVEDNAHIYDEKEHDNTWDHVTRLRILLPRFRWHVQLTKNNANSSPRCFCG